jgi:hypothetical protein
VRAYVSIEAACSLNMAPSPAAGAARYTWVFFGCLDAAHTATKHDLRPYNLAKVTSSLGVPDLKVDSGSICRSCIAHYTWPGSQVEVAESGVLLDDAFSKLGGDGCIPTLVKVGNVRDADKRPGGSKLCFHYCLCIKE